jgi:hypothetical protein
MWHDCPVDPYLPDFGFLTGLSRSWPSVELPGARPHPGRYATYSPFDWDRLPPVPEWVTADYSWLTASPEHADSTLALAYDGAQHDIGEWDTWAGPLGGSEVPDEFVRFARDPGLRRHLRSATDCVFDLGDHSVQVPGGRLVHFLSDSQWIRHWLVFTGDSGKQAVVTTVYPACFDLSPDDMEAYADTKGYQICADTFLEFIWRFWIENEIWFALSVGKQPLTPAQDEYIRHYAHK